MYVNRRLWPRELFLETELNPWNLASAWKKDRYGNVLTEIWPTLDEGGKKFEVRETLGSEPRRRIFHLDTRSARGCASPPFLRPPLEIIVETHRGNGYDAQEISLLPSTYTCIRVTCIPAHEIYCEWRGAKWQREERRAAVVEARRRGSTQGG